MKKALLSIVVVAALCGCESPKAIEADILTLIKSQKYFPTNGRPLTNDYDLYYIGWNDANENIAHHINERRK